MYIEYNSTRKKEQRFCKQCGKPYIWKVSNPSNYCSTECQILANEMITDEENKHKERRNYSKITQYTKMIGYRSCAYCGKIYDLSSEEHYNKYCSILCGLLGLDKEDNIEFESRECKYCQKTFECPHFSERQYCSQKCEKSKVSETLSKSTGKKKVPKIQYIDQNIPKKKEIISQKKKYSYNETEVRICKNCGASFTWFPAKSYEYYCSENCKRESDELKKIRKVDFQSPSEKVLYDYVETKVNYLEEQLFLDGESYNGKCLDYWKIGDISKKTREQVLNRDQYECQVCGRPDHLHIHHIIKRRNGGNHDPENLVTLCDSCHRHIETGDASHAIRKCYKNAKRYYGKENKSLESYAGSVKGELEDIFSSIEIMNKDEFQEILIELDSIIEEL